MKKYYTHFIYSSLTLLGALTFSTSVRAQEISPADQLPREEIVRMQVEAMMTEDVNMMDMAYHKDVEIIMYPMVELAKGHDAAIAYWKKRFEGQDDFGYELMNTVNVGNNYIAFAKKMGKSIEGQLDVVIIFSFDKKRINRVTLIEP